MTRSPTLFLCAALAACGGASIDDQLGESRIVASVGPGGGTLRGDGSTELRGFRLVVPENALSRLVQVTVEPGPAIDVPGTTPVGPAYRIRMEPDPGFLRKPAELSVPVSLPGHARGEDLVVVSRPPAEEPSALADSSGRFCVLADLGEYDQEAGRYSAKIARLTDLQVRRATKPRMFEDSARLVLLGFEALARLTDASLLEADVLFSEAQSAEPFDPAANLLRALSRVLVVLNDRSDTGRGLDSVGEALTRFGVDVGTRSLVTRARTAQWPRRITVPAGAPTTAAVVDMARRVVRPAIELALRDLDRVPLTTALVVQLPARFTSLPGDRELDAADVLFFQSLLSGTLAALQIAEDLDLEVDLAVVQAAGPERELADFLALFPSFAAMRSLPAERTIEATRAALHFWILAFEAVASEEDSQGDDLLVFPSSFASELDRWRGNLHGLLAALQTEQLTDIVRGDGTRLRIDLLRPWRSGALDLRLYLPRYRRFLPVAGTLPDPRLSGFLPDMTQDHAVELIGMVDEHDTPTLPIVADGLLGDWTAAAEGLAPPDPVGDVEPAGLRALDLTRVWFANASGGDEIALRLQVADGPIAFRPEQHSVYGAVIREVGRSRFGREIVIEVHVLQSGLEVRVTRDGVTRTVRSAVAVRDADLELTLDRYDLLDPDEPIVDRAVFAFSQGLDLIRSFEAEDRARGFVVRF